MSAPLESSEFANLYVGDTRDDDGPVIDSLVQEVDRPAEPQIQSIPAVPLFDYVKPTRALTGTAILNSASLIANGGGPIQIVPADLKRTHLHIAGYSSAATPGANDYAFLADESGKTQFASSAYRLRHNVGRTFDDYTGPIYVYPGPNISDTNAFEVSWLAVTK